MTTSHKKGRLSAPLFAMNSMIIRVMPRFVEQRNWQNRFAIDLSDSSLINEMNGGRENDMGSNGKQPIQYL
jgi:hypothetical protein